ncbi:DUF6264 family protein [Protaetiibacter mangrovi]|uniref:DUF6264 family protein n=1 Tax=Protaetiibacter mangrovi TaxID=2970926 RepID=A0ABT1ZF78_9MICO|nr:DUF6264 family protein [Protaetiibacter mangrovi]MCS0499355.1 DUF6264 family protein [Protaetiibacter mangrovi]
MSEPTPPPIPPVPPAEGDPQSAAPATASGVPAPRFGEFAPVEQTATPAAPAAPVAPAPAPAVPAPAAAPAPAYPRAGYPQAGYPQGYPGAAPAQPVYGQPGFGAAPAPRRRRTWDVVLTIILLVLGLFGMLIGLAYGALFSSPEILDEGFRQQGYDGFSGDVGVLPLVIIVSHVVLYLLAVGISIPLLVTKRIAFWVPLTIGVIAAILFWVLIFMILLTDPQLAATAGL